MIQNDPNILNNVSLEEDINNNSSSIFKRLKDNDVSFLNYYVEKNNDISQTLSGDEWVSISASYKNAIFTNQTTKLVHFQNYLEKYLQTDELDEPLSATSLYTIEIYKRNFGDFIKEVNSFSINDITMTADLTEYLSNNRFIKLYFDDSEYTSICDKYSGLFYLFTTATATLTSYAINYRSSQLRKELIINCNVEPNEFNHSTNPTSYSSTAYNEYTKKIQFNEELTYNGGLEEGSTTGWDSNYCTLSVLALENDDESYLTNYVYSGTHSLKVLLSDTSTTSCDIYQDIDLTNFDLVKYDDIRAEWYINKGTLTSTTSLTFAIEQYNGSSFTSTTSINISISSIPYNEWYRIVLFDKLQYSEQIRMKMTIDDNPADSTYFFLDHMSLRLKSSSLNRNNIWLTSIGLYDDYNNLLMIAKLGKPLRKGILPLNFKIKLDLL